MRRHVLMVAPYIHDFAAYDLWLKPLGLLYVAAAVERAGYQVRVVNCIERLHPAATPIAERHRGKEPGDGRGKLRYEVIPKPECLRPIPRNYRRYGIPREALLKRLSEGPRPDAIGVGSMMTYWYPGVSETIEMLKRSYPGVPVILGGPYATLCAEHARLHSGADIVIEGPGEAKLIDVLNTITGFDGGAKISLASLRPAYHLLDNVDSVSMLTSFGCPYSCAYCASRILQRKFVQRQGQDIVNEVLYYAHEMGIRNIAFYDDALLVNADGHMKSILREIVGMALDMRFHTPNGLHANMIDEDLAVLMRAGGFTTMRLSIESIHKDRLEDSCMKVTPEGFEAAVDRLFSAGYAVGQLEAYVLMGAPGQQPEEVQETIRFAHKTGAVVRLADFSPIPGTAYFEAAKERFGIDFEEPLFQNSSVYPHLVPGMHEQYQNLKDLAKSLNTQVLSQNSTKGDRL